MSSISSLATTPKTILDSTISSSETSLEMKSVIASIIDNIFEGNKEWEEYVAKLKLKDSSKEQFHERITHLKKAAELNHKEALYQLGSRLFRKKDFAKAYACWEQAAKMGHAESTYNIAIQKNKTLEERKALLQEAADKGSTLAQRRLAEFYFKKEDFKNCFSYMKKAADKGIDEAQFNIGVYYYAGIGVTKNEEKAIEHFKLAADARLALAQYTIGQYYVEGDVLEKNIDKGLEYLQKAADQNAIEAQRYLGYLYYTGEEVKQDFIQAEKYFKKAAAKDDEDAQKILCHKKFQEKLLEQQLYDP